MRLYTTWFSSTADGHEHAITDDEYTRARDAGRHPLAICQAVVQFVPLTVPPGARCTGCTEYLARVAAVAATPRHAKPSPLRRLLHKLRSPATA